MNIKDFLIDNYIYIIIVIVLIIVTIIGFLADKKTKRKNANKDILPNNNPNMGYGAAPQVPQQPITYQPVTENVVPVNQGSLLNNNIPTGPVNFGQVDNGMVNPVPSGMPNQLNNPVGPALSQETPSNGLNVMPGTIEGTIINPNMAPVAPVEVPVTPQPIPQPMPVNPEPMYQPSLEQTPVIMPTDPIANMQNYNQTINANNDLNNNQINNVPNVMEPVNVVPNIVEPVNNMPNYGGVSQAMPNVNPTPIPTPVTPVTPVAPIPPVPTVPVNPVPVANTTIPNPVQAPQPVNNGQLNFVYGNQANNQNNNGYMQ